MVYDGLVISGGAARGAVFLGALHELQHRKFLNGVKVVAGSSIGSLIAVLYTLGKNMNKIMHDIAGRPFNIDIDLDMYQTFGLDNGNSLLTFIRSLIGQPTFKQLFEQTGKEVVVCATCLQTRRPVYFGPRTHADMDVSWAVRLSCTLPFIFAYGLWDSKAFVDGGVTDNFPIEAALEYGCTSVVGLCFCPSPPTPRPLSLTDYVATLMSCAAWHSPTIQTSGHKIFQFQAATTEAFDFSMDLKLLSGLFEVGRKAVTAEIDVVNPPEK